MCQKSLKKPHLDPDTTLKNFFTEKKNPQNQTQTGDKQGTVCQWEKLLESLLKPYCGKIPGKFQFG